MTQPRLEFIVSRIRYDTLPQFLLDVLTFVQIRIRPFYLYREGLENLPATEMARAYEGCDLGLAGHEDVDAMLAFPDRRMDAKTLHGNLDEGHVCVVARSDGDLLAWSWANPYNLVWRGYRISMGDHEAYLYDAYTAPQGRGRGLVCVVRRELYRILAEQQKNRLYSVSDRFNTSAIRFKQKMGGVHLATGVTVNIFGRYWYRTPMTVEQLR